MIEYIIPLIAAYFQNGIADYYFFDLICLAFIVSVPGIIRYIIQWR